MTGGQDSPTAHSPDEAPPEEKPQDIVSSERASLVDVFENFLGRPSARSLIRAWRAFHLLKPTTW